MNKRKIGLLTLCGISLVTCGLISSCTVDLNGEEIYNSGDSEIANPWTEYATLDEASKNIGFEFNVPDTLLDDYKISSIRGELTFIFEVNYLNNNNKEISVRKGVGNKDISGDFNVYLNNDQVIINSLNVETYGNKDDSINLAIWNNEDYYYSLSVDNLNLEQVTTIINSIM